MLKGLIFDLDGVITDSAVYHLKAWQDLARGIGIELPEEFGDKLIPWKSSWNTGTRKMTTARKKKKPWQPRRTRLT